MKTTVEIPDAASKLCRASVKGGGLRPELRKVSWDMLRNLSYQGTEARDLQKAEHFCSSPSRKQGPTAAAEAPRASVQNHSLD